VREDIWLVEVKRTHREGRLNVSGSRRTTWRQVVVADQAFHEFFSGERGEVVEEIAILLQLLL
jgi:hypothetical protein